MADSTPAERMAHARAVQSEKRREAARVAEQHSVPPDYEPPVVVSHGEDVPPSPTPPRAPSALAPASPGTAPQLAPLPTFGPNVPEYQPFRYDYLQPLTPKDRDNITTYNELYMQLPGIGTDWQKYQDALRDAPVVLPLLEKQYELECRGVDGPHSQEAQQVKRNLAWVKDLLARAGQEIPQG